MTTGGDGARRLLDEALALYLRVQRETAPHGSMRATRLRVVAGHAWRRIRRRRGGMSVPAGNIVR